MYLFHGTQVSGIDFLKPMISLEYVPMVYATDNYAYALVRAGKQLDRIREEYYGLGKPFEIAECYPNAFKDQFDCCGYVYVLNSEDFDYNPETTEWRSSKLVKPVRVMHINNIWDEMQKYKNDYEFIYDGNEEYWSKVRGGKDGYLDRKRKAKQKMLELRGKLQ